MKFRHHRLITAAICLSVAALILSCGKDDNPVAPNNPPVISGIEVKQGSYVLPPELYSRIPAGQPLTLTCTATDADNDPLTSTWSANVGSFNIDDSSCVEWMAPDTSATVSIVVVVSDGRASAEDTLALVTVHTAFLNAGKVTPGSGNDGETFTYEVTFRDPTGNQPAKAEVFVNGEAHAMTHVSGEPLTGSLYRYETALGNGQHQYYFRFEDYRDSVLSEPAGSYAIGPAVTETGVLLGEGVIVIDELEGVSLIGATGSTYTFSFSGRQPMLEPGRIVVGTEPSGYLRKVVSSTYSAGQVSVETGPASLVEAITTGTCHTSLTFLIMPFGADKSTTTTVNVPDGVYIEEGRIRFEDVSLYSGTLGSATVSASIPQGEMTFEPHVLSNAVFDGGSLTEFVARTTGDLSVNCDFTVETDGPVTLQQTPPLELASFSGVGIQLLDWFPVWLEASLRFVATVELESEVSGEVAFGAESSSNIWIGCQYQDNSWAPEGGHTGDDVPRPSAWAEFGDMRARVIIKPIIEFTPYSYSAARLEAERNLQLHGQVASEPSCSWSLYSSVAGAVDITGGVYDVNVADYSAEVFRDETMIAEGNCFPVTLVTAEYDAGGASDDIGYSVVPTGDGGLVIAGSTESSGAGGSDVYLAKLNASGSVVWEETFGGAADDCGHSVIATEDGGFAVVGYTFSSGEGEGDVYLVKTDANGTLTWEKTFGGSLDDRGRSVLQTADGGYIIGGRARSWSGGICDFYLIKTDENGDTLWTRTYGGSGSDRAYTVVKTTDGGYALAGYTRSFGAVARDVWLVKVDGSGTLVWDEVFALTTGDDCAYSLVALEDGSLVMAGSTPEDAFLIKTDGGGSQVWQRTDLGGPWLDEANSLAPASDDGFLMTGFSHSGDTEPSDVYVVKTDSYGYLLWYYLMGGAEADIGYSVALTSDNSFAIAGGTQSYGSGGWDVYVIRADEISAAAW
ncbi:MAG: hypothetical protein JSW34_01365 [Candidatus Zixiibacteriota bacterium]|nr:MAG: hypothetical protein JSW34_01365 [candidate division Zixibacteria bacterium]